MDRPKPNKFFVLLIVALPLMAFVKGVNPYCFMQTSDGDTIDLSSLCESESENAEYQDEEDVSDEQLTAEYSRICREMNCQSPLDYYRAILVAYENLESGRPVLQGPLFEGMDTSEVYPFPPEWERVRSSQGK